MLNFVVKLHCGTLGNFNEINMKEVAAVILLIFLMFLVSQVWYFYRETDAAEGKLQKLQADLGRAQNDQAELKTEYEFYLNPANLEKELRARFNYRSPGEKLIIVVPQQTSSTPR